MKAIPPNQSFSQVSPLVSVVICSFNVPADYFREAIESVRHQTYQNWELLIVDNGSTNGCDAVAKEYGDKLPNLRYLEHPGRSNLGPAASRNLGIREARGELIAFLDADDYWLPGKLDEQVEAMQAHPAAALSFGGILRWYNGAEGKPDEAEVHTHELEVLSSPALLHRLLLNQCIPGMSALMVRRQAAKVVGGFEERLIWAEDQTISYKLGLDNECLILPGWQVKYRQHPASTSSGVLADGRIFTSHLLFLDWVVDYFTKAEVKDEILWSKLRKLHRQYRGLVFKEKWIPSSLKRFLKRNDGKLQESPAGLHV